ncbi:hypothetical protein D6T69_06810 [Tenacibaculum singaporense]|uniref:Uncharacterized protein n=1 Tax=Tenacibaculum singaporense TaxID=2358479 RepID=A0A3S8R658_9FLAO|nr:hypothetical protein [Tenacibaculum singaporense]AZJ35244.1 hypothetical protein D6T69_06810 [Tenacibaculum singaporense]
MEEEKAIFQIEDCNLSVFGMNQLLLLDDNNSLIGLLEITETKTMFYTWDSIPKSEIDVVNQKYKSFIRLLMIKDAEYFKYSNIEDHHFSEFEMCISSEKFKNRINELVKDMQKRVVN